MEENDKNGGSFFSKRRDLVETRKRGVFFFFLKKVEDIIFLGGWRKRWKKMSKMGNHFFKK